MVTAKKTAPFAEHIVIPIYFLHIKAVYYIYFLDGTDFSVYN